MGRALAVLTCCLLACAGSLPARWPGWTEVDRGPLHFQAPADLRVEDLGDGRLRLERHGGWPLMEARLSLFCPDAASPGIHASAPGRFASPLAGLPGGEDRFYAIVAGADRCLLLRFFGLWDDGERIIADHIAASVHFDQPVGPTRVP